MDHQEPTQSSTTVRWLSVGLTLLGATGACCALAFRRLGDFDLPIHLASGRVVVETGRLMFKDQLSFRAQPVQWAENVMDVGQYAAIRIGGPFALQVLGAVIAVSTLVLLYWQSRSAGPAALLVTALAAAAMHQWFIARAATLSFAFLAALLLLLACHRQKAGTREGARALAAIPFLHLIWSNSHAFVVLGVALMGGYFGYRLMCHLACGRIGLWAPRADGSDLLRTGVISLLTLAASCLNQAGPGLLLGPLRASHDFGRITEWATTTPTFLVNEAPVALCFAAIALLALLFGRDPDTRQRIPTLFDLGLVVLALVLARSAVRLIPVGILLVTPLVARRLGTLVPSTKLSQVASALSTCLVAPWMLLSSPTTLGIGFEPTHFSEELIQYIRTKKPRGRMYNFFAYGGWLAWRLYPTYQVMVDGRQAWVHGAPFMKLYYASQDDPVKLEALANQLGLSWAVTRAVEGEGITPALARSPRWVMTYWNETSAVYVRKQGDNAPLVKSGYRLFRHLTFPASVLSWALRPGPHRKALAHDGCRSTSARRWR